MSASIVVNLLHTEDLKLCGHLVVHFHGLAYFYIWFEMQSKLLYWCPKLNLTFLPIYPNSTHTPKCCCWCIAESLSHRVGVLLLLSLTSTGSQSNYVWQSESVVVLFYPCRLFLARVLNRRQRWLGGAVTGSAVSSPCLESVSQSGEGKTACKRFSLCGSTIHTHTRSHGPSRTIIVNYGTLFGLLRVGFSTMGDKKSPTR